MNLRETILAEHSKAHCRKIAKWVGQDPERFRSLFHLFSNDEYRVVQRAAWPLSYAVEAYPALIRKYFPALFRNLERPGQHEAVRRNTLRILALTEIPERWQGKAMQLCFDCIVSHSEKPAVKAYALAILEQLAKRYPEILPEIRTIIETQWDNETAAFRSRAKRFLR